MSGGVDSSVAAAILKKEGFNVAGLFMDFWKEKGCPGGNKKSLEDAKKVAKILDIPLKIIKAQNIFKKKVVGYFLEEYKNGKTPNPCVFCNENIKFRILLDEMKKAKADLVATGHYALICRSGSGKKGFFQLFQAKDENKDQSYFLYRLNAKDLSRIIFPLGCYKKEEIRKMARDFKLPVFDKAESQNTCFIKDDNTARFLKDNLKLKKGEITDRNGKVLGFHGGLSLYTMGQRKGIDIGGTGPYYVSDKDIKNNKLIVTNNPKDTVLYAKEIYVKKANWIKNDINFPFLALVKTRYRQKSAYAIIKKEKKGLYKIEFKIPQRAVSPGQSAVFYSKNGGVLGGGIIK